MLTSATLLLALPLASAFSFNSSFVSEGWWSSPSDFIIPASFGLSLKCAAAYSGDIPCDGWLIKGMNYSGGSESIDVSGADDLCTDECLLGLRTWRDTIRSDCTLDEVEKANATYWDGTSGGEAVMGNMLLTDAFDEEKPLVEFMYWPYCMKDSNTGKYCVESMSDMDLPFVEIGETNSTAIASFCGSSCMTQAATFTWDITSKIFGYGTDDINIGNTADFCPDIDVEAFAFMKATSEPVSASGSTGSGSTSGNGSNSTATNGTVITDTNAAGAVKAGMWGVATVAAVVVVGML